MLKNQERDCTSELENIIGMITDTGEIDLEDCPVAEIEPLFERNSVHRVVREDEIVDYLLNDEKEEDVAEEIEREEAQLDKRQFTAKEKLNGINHAILILEQAEESQDIIMALENYREKYHREAHSKQSKVTNFFFPSN